MEEISVVLGQEHFLALRMRNIVEMEQQKKTERDTNDRYIVGLEERDGMINVQVVLREC